MAIKFSGINISSKDAYKAYEFYKGLGFPVLEVDDDPSNEWWCAQFDINGSILWIWKDHSGGSTENSGHMTLVITCEDIHKSYEDFKASGYAVSQPEKMFYGGWEMHLTDLDGNKILFLD